jgi:hypothetical protein
VSNSERNNNVEQTTIDSTLLYGVWTSQPDGNADFRISPGEFYVVEFFESSDFSLHGNELKVEDSDYYLRSVILNLTKDSLRIKWEELDLIYDYWRFEK